MFPAKQTRWTLFSGEARDNMPIFQSCNIRKLSASVSFFQGSISPLFVVSVFASAHLCLLVSAQRRDCCLYSIYKRNDCRKVCQSSWMTQTDPVVMSSAFNPWLEINLQRLRQRPSPSGGCRHYCQTAAAHYWEYQLGCLCFVMLN